MDEDERSVRLSEGWVDLQGFERGGLGLRHCFLRTLVASNRKGAISFGQTAIRVRVSRIERDRLPEKSDAGPHVGRREFCSSDIAR